jgi:hypothetical protein
MMKWGSWWAIQTNSGLSLGIHLEPRSHMCSSGTRYGPYVDFHILCFVVSVGRNPIYAGEFHLLRSYSRGGLSGNSQ